MSQQFLIVLGYVIVGICLSVIIGGALLVALWVINESESDSPPDENGGKEEK